MFEVILFVGLALKFFSGTTESEQPTFTVTDRRPSGGHALSAFLIMIMALITGGALLGTGDTATYTAVRAGGGDDAVTAVAGAVVVGMFGALMLINGCAPKLGLLIFLGGVVLSVMMAEMTSIGVTS
jgi:hypothetical protein